MTNEELMALVMAKKAEIEANDAKLTDIRARVADLGELPTLSKLRSFLNAIKTLVKENLEP